MTNITTISNLEWSQRHAALPPDAIACFAFLVAVANDRDHFAMPLDELLKMTSACSADRFLTLCRQLEAEGLIEMRSSNRRVEPNVWIVKQRPPWKLVKLGRDGERFNIPKQKSNLCIVAKRESRTPLPSAETLAYASARAKCERRGAEFPYRDFTEFLKAVGPRPEGTFAGSGHSLYALFRIDDATGKYQWRPKWKRR